MAKKQSLSEVFTTAKTKKQKEVLSAIKKYCMNITKEDLQEIHRNVVEYFELNDSDVYFDIQRFWEEVKNQKRIKEEKQQQTHQ